MQKPPCAKNLRHLRHISNIISVRYNLTDRKNRPFGLQYQLDIITQTERTVPLVCGETLFPDLAITDQVKGTGSKWERYLALRPMILDIEASLAEEFFSPELMVRLRNEVLRKTHTADLARVINAIRGQVVDILNGGSIRMRDMIDVVNHIRCYPNLFPEWHASETAKLFAPPVFRNEKKASGYFF